MKQKNTILLCVVILLHGLSYAQKPPAALSQHKVDKPALFASLPQRFEVDASTLRKLFEGQINEQINTQLSSQLSIRGKIIDKSQPTAASQSINMRLENFHNALFNVTVRLMPDNSVGMQGRIVHPRFGDVLILRKEKSKYFFEKKDQRLYMPE